MKAAVGIGLAAFAGAVWAQAAATKIEVYSGEKAEAAQLGALVGSPVAVRSPSYNADGSITVPMSADKHYYVHGFVNGCPVTWLIDTGASVSTLPLRMARPCGLRAGVVSEVETGGGRATVGVSEGNRVGVGPVGVDKVKVAVSAQIPLAVLGMNVLERFQLTAKDGVMTLRLQPPSQTKP